jgi:hypothetical protein
MPQYIIVKRRGGEIKTAHAVLIQSRMFQTSWEDLLYNFIRVSIIFMRIHDSTVLMG